MHFYVFVLSRNTLRNERYIFVSVYNIFSAVFKDATWEPDVSDSASYVSRSQRRVLDEDDSVSCTSSSLRRVFNAKDGLLIRKLFPKMIQGDVTIRKMEVIGVVKVEAPQLLESYTEEQILLRVRTEKRARDRRIKAK